MQARIEYPNQSYEEISNPNVSLCSNFFHYTTLSWISLSHFFLNEVVVYWNNEHVQDKKVTILLQKNIGLMMTRRIDKALREVKEKNQNSRINQWRWSVVIYYTGWSTNYWRISFCYKIRSFPSISRSDLPKCTEIHENLFTAWHVEIAHLVYESTVR